LYYSTHPFSDLFFISFKVQEGKAGTVRDPAHSHNHTCERIGFAGSFNSGNI
jgi:hypothetical protein